MKTFKLTVLFLFLPIIFFGQTLTGLWIGSVTNDSITVRKDQSFEIVLTQYKNKVYGFSRSTFIVNDSLFYIVKRVKGTIEGDVCEVKDDEVVSYNFKGRLNKGVKMTTTFRFDKGDSTWRMEGDWKTNTTKKYYSVSGKATLNQEKDLTKSKILPHLEELKLADDVEFYKESKKAEEQIAAAKPPEKNNNTGKPAATVEVKPAVTEPEEALVTIKRPAVTKQDTKVTSINSNNNAGTRPKSEPVAQAKQPVINVQKTEPTIDEKATASSTQNRRQDNISNAPATTGSPAQTTQAANDNKTAAVVKQEPKKSEPVVVVNAVEQKKNLVTEPPKTEIKKQETVSADPAKEKPQNASVFAETKPVVSGSKTEIKKQETVSTDPVKEKPQNVSLFTETKPVSGSAALLVAARKTTPPQVVNYKSDSLVLALYDNGEVDGDTVSVLLNGEVIIAKECLKVSAIKKTIYVPKDDSLTLVLYAENLGKYPPNTGLLIVHDGDDSYQIRFSADLQQNAAVIFKRKRN